MKTETRQIPVERWSVESSRPYDAIIAALDAAIGHPDMRSFSPDIYESASDASLRAAVAQALGPSGFMEFMRFDLGAVVRAQSKDAARIHRFVIGNPLIMREMVKYVPDAGSYAPVTILVVEQAGSVRISYDTMASFLAPYGSAEASQVARELDTKVQALIAQIAG
jgi:uncharacterized protein (DUF302 family)